MNRFSNKRGNTLGGTGILPVFVSPGGAHWRHATATRRGLLCALVLAALAAGAKAQPTTAPVTFSGPDQQFSLGLGASGDATVSGNGVYRLVDNNFLKIREQIDIPQQTRPLQMSTTLVSNPAGSATIGFDNPSLANGTLANLNVDFRNGAGWGFAFTPMVFDVNVQDVGNIGLRLEISGSVTGLSFVADPGATPLLTAAPGTWTANISGHVTGVAQDVIGGADFDLGELTTFDTTGSVVFPFISNTLLASAGPPNPSDLTVDLGFLLPLSIPISLDTSGHVDHVEGPGTGNLDLFVDYSINGDLTFSNLDYALHGTIPGVLVPEPSSFVLAGLAACGLFVWRRKRVAASPREHVLAASPAVPNGDAKPPRGPAGEVKPSSPVVGV
jgi:hypothetical protein